MALVLLMQVMTVQWADTILLTDLELLRQAVLEAQTVLNYRLSHAPLYDGSANGAPSTCPGSSLRHQASRASTIKSRRMAQAAKLFEETTKALVTRLPGGLEAAQSLQSLADQDLSLEQASQECNLDSRIVPCDPDSAFRRSEGSCNNLANPRWGMAGSCMSRLLEPAYQDGISSPRVSRSGKELPNARLVSSTVHPDRTVPSPRFSHMLMQFGQFMDHDVALAPLEAHPGEIRNLGNPNNPIDCCTPERWVLPECYSIAVPEGDEFFAALGQTCLNMPRSAPCSCKLGYREQQDALTSYLDLSQVYGSSTEDTLRLRLGQGGLLRTQTLDGEELLPRSFYPDSDRCSNLEKGEVCFRAGDERVNEHPALACLHTVWLRQHNKVARELARLNSLWDDERLFQETRRIVGAQWQHIAYSEWMLVVLGPDAMARYQLTPTGRSRYSPTVDGSLLNEFASAAFRLGHTLIDGVFNRVTEHGEASPYELQDFYFFPFYLYHGDMDNVVRGLLRQSSQDYDSFVTIGVSQHLYRLRNESYGLDLIALNLQRGREHGLRPYIDYLTYCTGHVVNSFDDLLRYIPAKVVNQYISLYEDVTDIDLFTGGVSETSVPGGLVGPTFACILGETFNKLKFGDRFYYEHEGQAGSFAPEQLQQIRKTSLSQILCDNSYSLRTIQLNAMLGPNPVDNPEVECESLPRPDLSFWQYP
ncbi:peroxidase [Ixodes scapularis]|nr:peroxidase [Ixodes scapularis]